MSVSPVTGSHHGRRPRLLAALAAAAILAVGVTTLACAVAGRGGTQARAAAPSVEARSGILIDRQSGKVLWSKNPDLRVDKDAAAGFDGGRRARWDRVTGETLIGQV